MIFWKIWNIKNWDMIKDADNLESTKSKMGPFADDWSINDDFYLVKGQLISEWLFQKQQLKNSMKFWPRILKLVNFCIDFLENLKHQKVILELTDLQRRKIRLLQTKWILYKNLTNKKNTGSSCLSQKITNCLNI